MKDWRRKKCFTGAQVYLLHPILLVVKKNVGRPEKNIDFKLIK